MRLHPPLNQLHPICLEGLTCKSQTNSGLYMHSSDFLASPSLKEGRLLCAGTKSARMHP